MLSAGMLASFAAATAARSRALPMGSPPPDRAATVISRISLVKIRPPFASSAAFLCLMVLHLECPDMDEGAASRGLISGDVTTAPMTAPAGDRMESAGAKNEKARRPERVWRRAFGSIPATTYSSTQLPVQYHRRWRA